MSGSDESFEQFSRQAYPRLVAALTHHCGDVHLAEDCAQEALVRAYPRWEQVRKLDAPTGWCFHVGANLARSWFRRQRAEGRARARLAAATSESPGETEAVEWLAVRQALDGLRPRQREVVLLRYFLGLSAPEVAAITGSTAGAVRVLTHRAIGNLRQRLGPGSSYGPLPTR